MKRGKARAKARRHDPPPAWSKVLTPNEQGQVWDYLDGKSPSRLTGECLDTDSVAAKRLDLMVDILMQTGLRSSELVKLRIEHTPFVLGTMVLEIRDTKYRRDRTVEVSFALADAIKTYILHTRPKTKPRRVTNADIKRPLFYNNRRRPYTARSSNGRVRASETFRREIKSLGLHAGFRKALRPHMFRHTFAVNTLRTGVDVRTLQAKMGHSALSITERYVQLVNTDGLGEKLDTRPRQKLRIMSCETA